MASKSSSGDNKGLKPKSSAKAPKSGSKTASKTAQSDGEDTVAIDLTNPDDLLKKLDQLDLDDDEADALLKRAYEVNRELKKQLELGRKVMDKKLSASSKGSAIGQQRRPGSNLISIHATPNHPGQRQTRMASASHSAGSRKASKGAELNHSMQSYSYHSYKDKNELKQPKKK